MVCAAALVTLTAMVVAGTGVVALDQQVRTLVRAHRLPGLVHAGRTVTTVVSPVVDIAIFALFSLVLAARRRSWAPLRLALAALAALAVAVLSLKYAVSRPMPSGRHFALGDFPSGHTASLLICAGAALLAVGPSRAARWAGWAVVSALTGLIGLLLIYINAHWASDVLASVAIGVGVLSLLAAARTSQAAQSMDERGDGAQVRALPYTGSGQGPKPPADDLLRQR